MSIHVMTVLGARPQFVKAAVVSKAIQAHGDVVETIVHTGQHFDDNMSTVFFDEMDIPRPQHHLNIHSMSHGAMTGRMLEAIEAQLLALRPDWVLVYGDTNSTLAGALAASKLHIPVAHVEAGLRSFNRAMPEEINRILTDHTADLLLTPTDTATARLLAEGIPPARVVQCGDVMQDAALAYVQIARQRSDVLVRLGLCEASPIVLCTVHRAENTDDPVLLRHLFDALAALGRELQIVLPLHPRTRALAAAQGIELRVAGVTITDPLGFLDMVRLEQAAALILTDSGGVQKEAFFHGRPCVTFREQTEWVELVDSGWNVLCPLQRGARHLVDTVRARIGTRGLAVSPYGAPGAAERVVAALVADRRP
ncbi:MAG: UDP-N-acetylglucosamine 2-epimerase (non-hydrolyzing) [Burkholderiaceae bacterium]